MLEEKENETAPSLTYPQVLGISSSLTLPFCFQGFDTNYNQSEHAITSSMNNLSLTNASVPPRPRLIDCDTDSDDDGEGSGGVWVEQPSSSAYGTRMGGSAMMSRQSAAKVQSPTESGSQADTASAASGQANTVTTASGAKMHQDWKAYNVTPRPSNEGTSVASSLPPRKFASSKSMVCFHPI